MNDSILRISRNEELCAGIYEMTVSSRMESSVLRRDSLRKSDCVIIS